VQNRLESNIQEEVSPETEAFVKEHHQVVAKCVTPEQTYVLVRLGEKGESTPETSTGSTNIPQEPSWATDIPREPGYIYASGQSNLYRRESDSWRNAEKSARIALALSVETKVQGLIKRFEDQTTFSISAADTDTQLNNIQIIARWKHPEMNTCHVLVRMKESR